MRPILLGLTVVLASGQQSNFVFRYIAITPTDSIVLGRPFAALSFADRVDRTTYQLKDRSFGGTERIRVRTDTLGTVVAMEFQYRDGARFQQMLQDYIGSLGRPTTSDSTACMRLAVWQDSQTRFELRSAQVGARELVTARMTDVTKR